MAVATLVETATPDTPGAVFTTLAAEMVVGDR
jgi:hypothetical protein